MGVNVFHRICCRHYTKYVLTYLPYIVCFLLVITRRLDFICRRFGTLCLFHLHRQVDVRLSLSVLRISFLSQEYYYCYENTCCFLAIRDQQNMTYLQLKNTIPVKISVKLKITYK